MLKLWLIDFMCSNPHGKELPVVLQSDREPTRVEGECAVYSAEYRFAPIYIESITETSESEMRGKQYYLVGAK
ncbi:hypothetical protein [Sulfuricurvum sp.]|uniref:hypothetical protein n=1 Tax=Sulfuricurvum sp. TaxID=2025608 RepID=UPI002624CA0A|nr:hypothetical protein [Sulfuricurvum sp.]MDD2267488.1 hypothetical protein [Sulfuricurvum sp.]MDD2783964.1 hypothetical protein [Sulfuricurvum sp.]